MPIGSEPINNTKATDEEVEQTLKELEEEFGIDKEKDEDEEESEFDLGLPSAEELQDSIKDTFRKVPVVDVELEPVEPVESANGEQEKGEVE